MIEIVDHLIDLGSVILLICLVLLPLLAIPQRTRRAAGIIYIVASVYFGLCLWILSAATVYQYWGFPAVLVGVFLLGVGVLPMAIIIDLWNGLWGPLIILLSWLVPLGLARFGGAALMASAEKMRRKSQAVE